MNILATNFEKKQISTAKILITEKNQTVIVSNDIHFLREEIFIKQIGDAVVLIPKEIMHGA